MEVEIDETVCGPLCQHPSCWESHKRLYKGRPRHAAKTQPPTSPDEQSLPTQNIVNLLDAYGEDHYDYSPPKRINRRAFSNSSSATALYSNRPPSRDSYPKMKTPMVTPASLLQSSSVNIGETTPQQLEAPVTTVNKVEVQEVFDLDDLRSDWHDTFVARQYYVWVPNPNASKEKAKQTKSIKQSSEVTDSHSSVLPKDMTETMIPRHVSWERNTSKMRRNIGSPKTPQQGLHLPNRSAYSTRTPKEYYGIYELLDLPRDVLVKVLRLIDRRDLVDREHLIDALVKVFPQLEHQNSSLSMAYGDVLQQSKLQLHDDRPHKPHLNHIDLDLLPTKQMYIMDVGSHGQSQYVHIPSELLRRPLSPLGSHRLTPLKPNVEVATRELSQKHPLPSITGNMGSQPEKKSPRTIKMAPVSLGLPQLPSGVKITRPFAYNQKYLDLTLGPMTQPSLFEPVPLPQKPAISPHQDQAYSPAASDRASSIVVTMPSVPTEHTEPDIGGVSPLKNREVTFSTSLGLASESSWDAIGKNQPLHAVSPSYSTNVPNAPAGTPAMRQSGSFIKDLNEGSPSPTKLYMDVYGSPLGVVPPVGVSAILKPISTPETQAGGLDTIRESEPDEQVPQPADYRLRSELPKSRRSVRFAADVPRQPPSTPNSSNQNEALLHYQQQIGHPALGNGSVSNNPSETTPDILTLHDDKMVPSSLPPSRDTRTTSAETWPQVNEEAFNRTPTPPISVRSLCTPADPDQSMAAQYDAKSELSDMTSLMQHSRESSFHSTKKASIMRERVGESPGPPPPSPEPKDGQDPIYQMAPLGRDDDGSDVIDELADSESGVTISAKPPSNLDDVSTIQTPATPQRIDTGNEAITKSRDHIPEVSTSEEGKSLPAVDSPYEKRQEPVDGTEDESDLKPSETPVADDDGDDDDDNDDNDDMEISSTKPQQPAYPGTATSEPDPNEPLLNRTPDVDDKRLHLDHFEANDDTFKAELEHELSRLSEEQDQQENDDEK